MLCEPRPALVASRVTAAATRRVSASRPRQASSYTSARPAVPMTPGFPVAAEISGASAKQARAASNRPATTSAYALVVQRYRQRGQRPLVAGQLNQTDGQRVLGLVVE